MKLLISASVALVLMAIPASAAVPVPVMKMMGTDFYMRCTDPSDHGREMVAMCAAYVAGIADDLVDEHQVCLSPRATPTSLLPYVLNWMRIRSANGAYPAALQIRTGLHTMFPCRPITPAAQRQQMSLGDIVGLGTKFAAFWREISPLLALLH